jgi:hypothetical protein
MTVMTDSGTSGSFENKGFQNFRFQLFKGGYDEGMQMCIPFMCGVIQLFVIIMSFNIDD